MKYAIVFSSKTGNTKQLAETIQSILPQEDCVYFGKPDEAALAAEMIYVGFWTDKGNCDETVTAFLQSITVQKVFLFGTAGFGGEQAYFDRILSTVAKNTAKETIMGTYMCQGKMPVSVRRRYEKMLAGPNPMPNLEAMIENFDKALSHPDETDLEKLKKSVLN